MKVALIHEWLATYAGSDKVLAEMVALFPTADVFCLIDRLPKHHRAAFSETRITPSFLQRIPWVDRLYPYLLPLMPIAIEQHDLSAYDLIISNSHSVAKGVLTGADQLHICYCYTPPRYAWDFQHQYLRELGYDKGLASLFVRYFLHRTRIWDYRTANSVDHFVACSAYIARRIWKAYRRDSTVIYPHVEVDRFVIGNQPRESFYLASSRLVPYKQIQLIVNAFASMPERRLVVIGAGPLLKRVREEATSNVTVMGFQPFPVLLEHMQKARAFIFASEEDFGIAPLEAQACGTPVLAYGKGGALETVVDGETGLYFKSQTVQAIHEVIARFEAEEARFDRAIIRKHAERFSTRIFRIRLKQFVDEKWSEHQRSLANSYLRQEAL